MTIYTICDLEKGNAGDRMLGSIATCGAFIYLSPLSGMVKVKGPLGFWAFWVIGSNSGSLIGKTIMSDTACCILIFSTSFEGGLTSCQIYCQILKNDLYSNHVDYLLLTVAPNHLPRYPIQHSPRRIISLADGYSLPRNISEPFAFEVSSSPRTIPC